MAQAEEELGDVPEGQFRSVSVGDYHACALSVDGEIHCWGRNRYGETDVPE